MEYQQSYQDLKKASAGFVHDLATPLVIIDIRMDILEKYMPDLLAAYQHCKPSDNEIPEKHYVALQQTATDIREQVQLLREVTKQYWKQINGITQDCKTVKHSLESKIRLY